MSYRPAESCMLVACWNYNSSMWNIFLDFHKILAKVRRVDIQKIIIIGCCVSGMKIKDMINECWTPQSNHRDTYILLVNVSISFEWYNRIYNRSIENFVDHGNNKWHTFSIGHVLVLEVIWLCMLLCYCTGSHLTERCIVLLVTCYQVITTG